MGGLILLMLGMRTMLGRSHILGDLILIHVYWVFRGFILPCLQGQVLACIWRRAHVVDQIHYTKQPIKSIDI